MSTEAGTESVIPVEYNVVPDDGLPSNGHYEPDVSRETSPDDEPAAEDLLNGDAIAESLTGFDEIAIEQFFKAPLAVFAKDQMKVLRALYFVHLRRGADMTDKAAWRACMEMRYAEVQGKFADSDNGADPDAGVDRGARDRDYAAFIMASGVPYTVDEYNGLTLSQKAAVLELAHKRK